MYIDPSILVPAPLASQNSVLISALTGQTALIGPVYIERVKSFSTSCVDISGSTISGLVIPKSELSVMHGDVFAPLNDPRGFYSLQLSNVLARYDTPNGASVAASTNTITVSVSALNVTPQVGDIIWYVDSSVTTLVRITFIQRADEQYNFSVVPLVGTLSNLTNVTISMARVIPTYRVDQHLFTRTLDANGNVVITLLPAARVLLNGISGPVLATIVGSSALSSLATPYTVPTVRYTIHRKNILTEPTTLSTTVTALFDISSQEYAQTRFGLLHALRVSLSGNSRADTSFVVCQTGDGESLPVTDETIESYRVAIQKLHHLAQVSQIVPVVAPHTSIVTPIAQLVDHISESTGVQCRVWLPSVTSYRSELASATVTLTNGTLTNVGTLLDQARVGDEVVLYTAIGVRTAKLLSTTSPAQLSGIEPFSQSSVLATVYRASNRFELRSAAVNSIATLPTSPHVLYLFPIDYTSPNGPFPASSVAARLASARAYTFPSRQLLFYTLPDVLISGAAADFVDEEAADLADAGYFVLLRSIDNRTFVYGARTSGREPIYVSREAAMWVVYAVRRALRKALTPLITMATSINELQTRAFSVASAVLERLSQIQNNGLPLVTATRVREVRYNPITPHVLNVVIELSVASVLIDTIVLTVEFTNE